jgi:hypothetical protein
MKEGEVKLERRNKGCFSGRKPDTHAVRKFWK